MPTLFAVPTLPSVSAPRRAAGVTAPSAARLSPAPHVAFLAAARAAREAANLVYHSAASNGRTDRHGAAGQVRRLDSRVDQAQAWFGRVTGCLSPADSARVSREVDLAHEAFGRAWVALTTLRCEAARQAPRGIEVRFLSAQVYTAIANVQALGEGIHRKLELLAEHATAQSPAP